MYSLRSISCPCRRVRRVFFRVTLYPTWEDEKVKDTKMLLLGCSEKSVFTDHWSNRKNKNRIRKCTCISVWSTGGGLSKSPANVCE